MDDVAFVIEQALGHVTHGDNLRRHVPEDPDVRAHWVLVPFDVEGPAARIPVYRSNWTVRAGWRARRALADVTRTTDLDAVFFHTQVPAMLCPDWMRRVPSVVSLDATPRQYDELGGFYGHATQGERIERLKHRVAVRRFAQAAHVVTWSAWAKRGLVADYDVDPEAVTVIPPGVSVDAWARPHAREQRAGRLTVLFVGGDFERKGGRVLLDAVEALREAGVEIEVHVVTRDAVPSRPGVVVHRGLSPNSAELTRLYHDADAFVLPTFGDCLPMVLSEAGAAGVPVISTAVAAIPEVVLDGDTGLLVPPGDARALAIALRHLAERPDERVRMGSRAVEHVAREYDAGVNARRLLEVLKRAARSPRGPRRARSAPRR
jgi:glycosyltransferase involved in cell wall biosynthesis